MSSGNKFPLEKMQAWARACVQLLAPHCDKIEIAGSIRRRKPEVGDIEIVCIPKRNVDLLGGRAEVVSGFADAINQWEKVKGEAWGKYTQRILPIGGGVKLDLFMTDFYSWGWILALRTGSADFNQVYLRELKALNYESCDGKIYDTSQNSPRFVSIKDEADLFKILDMPFVQPEDRK